MQDVLEHARQLGLRVKWRDLGRRNGELHSSGLIIVHPRRNVNVQRFVIAHECGHWVHGHDWSAMHDRAADERQADTYAADVLISPVEYRLAEQIAGSDARSIARELGVPVRLVDLWRARYAHYAARMVG